jgi:hypothetical protein
MPMLPQIQLALLSGKHPRDFGAEFLDDGAQRAAYLFGDYVIKEQVPAWKHDMLHNDDARKCDPRVLYAIPVLPFKRLGVCPPEQHVYGRWVVQPYYRPLTAIECAEWEWLSGVSVYWQPQKHHRIKLDMHTGNMGVHLRVGTVHAFDW